MKKKILFIIGSLQLGGAEKHLVNLLPQLSARGWFPSVITLSEKGPLAPDLEKQNIPVSSILSDVDFKIIRGLPRSLGRLLGVILRLFKLTVKLKKNKNDIIHFFLPEAYILGMKGASLAGFSGHRIMSRRSLNNYQHRRPFLAWLEKKNYSKTSIITGNSVAVVSQLHEEEKVPKEKLKLIYNGINPLPYIENTLRDETRKQLNIQNDALVIIKIANLIPYKGHSDLLKALNKIKNKLGFHWYLVCVGAGEDNKFENILQKETKWLGLEKNILWLGSRRDIPNLLASADIAVLCSHQEGFSNAILEGMAAGLPMVVTDVGGNKEAVLEGETGYVVPPKDPEALADAILTLANNREMALQFGKRGQQRVKECFSLESCVNAYEQLYESLS